MNSTIKRLFLFLVTNLIVVITIGFILSLLGISGEGTIGLMLLSFLWGMGGSFISLFMSKWLAKRAYGIKIIDPRNVSGTEIRIYEMVRRLAERESINVPEVGIYDSSEPNAFATGATKKSSMVAFSTGLIKMMNESELEAVAGHEIAHISNGDMVTLTLLTGIANAFVIFMARIIASAIDQALRDEDGGGLGFLAYFLIVSVLETVLMLLAYIPISAFSRHREYKADEGSAKITSALAMANALTVLGSYSGQLDKKNSYSIAKIESRKRISIFSTHPSIEQRIERLKAMR
ncbi:MAG: protease HtpX [Ignavibacteria bacterium]